MGAGRRRRWAWTLAVLALPLILAGCRGPQSVAPDLSGRDRYLAALREEHWQGEVLRPVGGVDARKDGGVQTVAHREPDSRKPRRLHLESFGNSSPSPGRGLQLRLEPRDAAGQPIQVSANLRIGVVQTGSAGARLLGSWDFTAEQLAACWDAQWSGAGYTVILPAQTIPSDGPSRAVARMTLADGSHLEAVLDLPQFASPPGPAATGRNSIQDGGDVRTVAEWGQPPLRDSFRLLRPVPLELPEGGSSR